jgi:phosphoglycerate kinase
MSRFDQFSFAGRRAVVRVDFNVPLDAAYHITDDTRIRAAVPTVNKILADGGSVVLMSHLGRPKNGPTDKYSLKHLVNHLSQAFGRPVQFAADVDTAIQQAANLQPGEILLVENLRFQPEEEAGDAAFSQKLAQLGDVYVNDAFGTAHRAHASTAVMAQYFNPENRYSGYVMQAELDAAKRVLDTPARPYVAVMGGAKVSDKILLIDRLLDKVDTLLIGGGMAYTFAKAENGSIGNSLVENDKLDLARQLIQKAKDKGVRLLLPVDSTIANQFANDADQDTALNHHIPDGWMGLDLGPDAREQFAEAIEGAQTILWNGPMGVFEMSNYALGTIAVAEAVARATDKGAYSLIGGGDSAAAVNQLGFADRVSYISTGGGALLEYMEGKALPGVAAIPAE